MKTLRVPFEVDSAGKIRQVEGDYAVAAQHLRSLIMTRVGERVMLRRYGTRTRDAVFEPVSDLLVAEILDDVRDAVAQWEPDIRINEIDSRVVDDSRLEFDVFFSLRSTVTGRSEVVSVSINVGGEVEETT